MAVITVWRWWKQGCSGLLQPAQRCCSARPLLCVLGNLLHDVWVQPPQWPLCVGVQGSAGKLLD